MITDKQFETLKETAGRLHGAAKFTIDNPETIKQLEEAILAALDDLTEQS